MRSTKPTLMAWIAAIIIWSLFLVIAGTGLAQPGPPALAPKGPSFDAEGKILQFSGFNPDRRGYTIEKIRVASNSVRAVPVKVALIALRHEDSNFPLEVDKWCQIIPSQGTASQNQPFEFDLKIQFPKKMPAGIPDGLFTGRLRIESPEAAAPVEAAIFFSLKLPNFTTVPANLTERGLMITMGCCLPGVAKTSFRITTDASTEQAVRVIAPPILINDQTQISLPLNEAWVSLPASGSQEADMTIRPGGSTTRIPVSVQVTNPALQAGRYQGQMAVRSEIGRTLFIPITLVIPKAFWVTWVWWGALLFIMLTVGWGLGRPLVRFRTYRNRFQGSTIAITRIENNPVIPYPWDSLITPVYRPDITGVENWQFSSTRCQATVQPPDPLNPPGFVILREGTSVSLTCGAEHYGLFVLSATPFQLFLRLTASPYRRSRLIRTLGLAIIFLGIGILSLVHPEFWCRFLQ